MLHTVCNCCVIARYKCDSHRIIFARQLSNRLFAMLRYTRVCAIPQSFQVQSYLPRVASPALDVQRTTDIKQVERQCRGAFASIATSHHARVNGVRCMTRLGITPVGSCIGKQKLTDNAKFSVRKAHEYSVFSRILCQIGGRRFLSSSKERPEAQNSRKPACGSASIRHSAASKTSTSLVECSSGKTPTSKVCEDANRSQLRGWSSRASANSPRRVGTCHSRMVLPWPSGARVRPSPQLNARPVRLRHNLLALVAEEVDRLPSRHFLKFPLLDGKTDHFDQPVKHLLDDPMLVTEDVGWSHTETLFANIVRPVCLATVVQLSPNPTPVAIWRTWSRSMPSRKV